MLQANARTTDTTVTMRVNGADTAITTTIGPGVINMVEDFTHTASVAIDDLHRLQDAYLYRNRHTFPQPHVHRL